MGLLGQDFVSRITGSAFIDANANTVTAPKGQAIIGVFFLAAAGLDSLIAKDATKDINTASSSNSTGAYTRTVNQGNATTNKIIFDEENFISKTNQVEVGDEVYDGTTGVLHGTVTALDPDGNNTKEIQISASVAITDDEVLAFQKTNIHGKGYINGIGTGGMTLASGNLFPAGSTIYGNWESLSLAADAGTAGAVVYFGE